MKKRTTPPVLIRILTFVLSLILFCSVCGALFVGAAQLTLDEDHLPTVIRQTVLAPGQADDLLVNFLHGTVMTVYGDRLGGEEGFTKEELAAFIDESTIKDHVADLGAALIHDLLTGENTATVDGEAVVAMLKENTELINTHFELEFTDEVFAAIATTFNEHAYMTQLREQGLANTVMAALGDSNKQLVNDLLDTLGTLISGTPLILCLVVSLVCAALIVVLNRKWLARVLYNCGMPLLLASLLPAALSICVLTMGEGWAALFTGELAMAGNVTKLLMTQGAAMNLGVCGGGLVLLVAALVAKILCSRKQKDEEIIEALSEALIEEEPVLISDIIEEQQGE